MNNNKMERLNGEVREREKIMRGINKKETPILKGYQIFHNYVRELFGLNDITPEEAFAGSTLWIRISGSLIQNAKRGAVNQCDQ